MNCYLCNHPLARIEVESAVTKTVYRVCSVCDETGVYCYNCERPIRSDEEKFYKDNAWGAPELDEPNCVDCFESAVDHYLETLQW